MHTHIYIYAYMHTYIYTSIHRRKGNSFRMKHHI